MRCNYHISSASRVMHDFVPSGMLQRKCACGQHASGGHCDECKKNETLQRYPAGSPGSTVVPPIVHDVLRSPGQPLDTGTRAFFEPRFGHDFSRVRVHTDPKASESAQALNAVAYTTGQDIVFARGSYSPLMAAGQRTLAHELTHVVQQEKGNSRFLSAGVYASGNRSLWPDHPFVSDPHNFAETEAERVSDEVLRPCSSAQPVKVSPLPDLTHAISRRAGTSEPTKAEEKADARLNFLATFPDWAIHDWKKLTPSAQTLVVFKMMGKYGADFATDFLAYAERKKKPNVVTRFTNLPSDTPESLKKHGYRFARSQMGSMIWVHPSGSEVVVLSGSSTKTTGPPSPPKPAPPSTGPDDIHERCVKHCLVDTEDEADCRDCCETTIPVEDEKCRRACNSSCDQKL